MKRIASVTVRRLLGSVALLSAVTGIAIAQAPKVFFACYVPESGTVYRIKETGTPGACGVTAPKGKNGVPQPHVEFSWTDGAGAAANTDHGALGGLGDDDHAQYTLADGVRNTTNGFAITGTVGTGTIPVSGEGARMMWYPGKAAFRAGWVNHHAVWDDSYIGSYSVAMGGNTQATGMGSVALGFAAGAHGNRAVALGEGYANGFKAFAAVSGRAEGTGAVAIGQGVQATGDYTMALGHGASTNNKQGAFVWADNSSNFLVQAQVNNQFVVRAGHLWLGNDNNVTATIGRFLETSTGAFLSSGGAWTNSSDVARKTGFSDVNGEQVLARLAAMPVSTWSYRNEDSTVRHMGPTAQDFRAAFALGGTDKAIATVDADGVSLAAIKALIERTATLQERVTQLEASLRQRSGWKGNNER